MKNFASDQDSNSSTVLKNMLKFPNFTSDDGWTLMNWLGKVVSISHRRKYLIHESGAVVTCQNSAWMDIPGMIMWCDLILSPYLNTKKAFLVFDNFRAHRNSDVIEYFLKKNIEIAFLPPNSTSELQPLDLVVNFPLKSAISRHRCEAYFKSLQNWSKKCVCD